MTTRPRLVCTTAQLSRTIMVGGAPVSVPDSVAHATTVGASYAVCGERTSGWHRFQTVKFDDALPSRCEKCVAALRALRTCAGP